MHLHDEENVEKRMNTPLLAGIPDSNVITYMTHGRPISDNDNNYYIIAHRESEVSFFVSFVCIVKVKTKIKANTMICLCRVECKYETWKHKNALSISIVWTVFARIFVAVLVAVIFNTWAKKNSVYIKVSTNIRRFLSGHSNNKNSKIN